MAGPKIQILRSFLPGVFPAPASLLEGELAANISDGRLFIGDSAGNPSLLGGGGEPPSLFAPVVNNSGVLIAFGSLVVLDYTVNPPRITLADSDDVSANMPATGLVAADIADGAVGLVQTFGLVTDVAGTNGLSSGQQLWTGSVGGLLAVEPVYPDILQPVGTVLYPESAPAAGDGTIWVDFSGELNSLDGGFYP